MSEMINIGTRSKQAQRELSKAGGAAIDKALNTIANALEKNTNYILEENAKDIRNASENDMAQAMIDRLTLTHDRICGMAQGMRKD